MISGLYIGPQARASYAAVFPHAGQRFRKRVVAVRGGDTTDGSRLIITADTPLDDYSSYTEGDRVYVLITSATLAGAGSRVSGRGFADMRVEQREDDVALSFLLRQGATVRIGQNFNRLELTFFTNEQASAHQGPKR